jgi:hypothetical protein
MQRTNNCWRRGVLQGMRRTLAEGVLVVGLTVLAARRPGHVPPLFRDLRVKLLARNSEQLRRRQVPVGAQRMLRSRWPGMTPVPERTNSTGQIPC